MKNQRPLFEQEIDPTESGRLAVEVTNPFSLAHETVPIG